jgi:glucokinase
MNDARAFTLAEGRMGAGQGCATLVGITLGTGVGGGVLIDGRLHLGHWGTGGEIGHLLVEDGENAALCGCGARGCLEAYLRADVLSLLGGRASAEEVYAGARDGDPACRAAVASACRHLGAALASLVNVLGPERIVIGGGVAAAGETLLEPLRAEVRRRLRLVPGRDVQIVPAVLGSLAGAMGAAVAAADAAAAAAADPFPS